MDRSIAPKINQISDIDIPQVAHATLSNGIIVHYVHEPNSEAFKIEALHRGGFSGLPNATTSSLLNKMLLEGTHQQKGSSFLNEVDSLGSFIESAPGFDRGTLSLFGLSRYFNENVVLFASALYDAQFDTLRLDKLKQKEVNRIKLNQEKGSYLTSIKLRSCLFGDHPYGFNSTVENVEALAIEDLLTYYQSHIQQFELFLSGDLPKDFISSLNQHFTKSQSAVESKEWSIVSKKADHFELRDSKYIQSSIRIGKVLFNRKHEDYGRFMLLNEILGGYFGSRLMKNIREEKGYTYGISSHLYALKEGGYFTIGTEVNQEAEADTLHQIKLEINKLQTELVGADELSTVKNYMLGSFANSQSAPFATIDKFKTLHIQGLDLDFYKPYIHTIKTTTSEELRSIAKKYLDFDQMSTAIVGSK